MLVLATALVAAWSAPEASAQNPSAPAYVGLGDSLAVGVGASDQASTAYVPLFHSFLKEVIDPAIQLRNFAVRGETSTSMVNSGQLDAALAEIANRQGNATPSDDVRVITLDIGGNDLASVLQGPCVSGLTAGCAAALQTTLATFSANLGNILSQLRAAAGPDARIIVMTYFNALANPGCPANALAAQGDIVLQGGPPLLTGLNPIIRELAAAYGAGVADVYGRVGPAETLPDCLHVNDSGYRTIAQQFTVGYGPSASATPNSPLGAGLNAVVVEGPDSAVNVSTIITTVSGRTVSVVWVFAGGSWKFFLPASPGVDGGLSVFRGPLTATFVVLT